MEKKNILTKILAITGTVFVWFPIVAPFFFSIITLFYEGRFRFDIMVPAILFPVIWIGWGLLIWAVIRADSHLSWIAGGAVTALVIMVVGDVLLRRVTGSASGASESAGWRSVLFGATFFIFWLAIMISGIGGILLLRDLFKHPELPTTVK